MVAMASEASSDAIGHLPRKRRAVARGPGCRNAACSTPLSPRHRNFKLVPRKPASRGARPASLRHQHRGPIPPAVPFHTGVRADCCLSKGTLPRLMVDTTFKLEPADVMSDLKTKRGDSQQVPCN